jgi:hypothetical protein
MKKYQNLVFLPASDELRQDLYKLGLDFMLCRIEGKLQFMVVTNQLRQIQLLAREHRINEFYASDSRRQIFKAIFSYHGSFDYHPVKLGRLKRSETGNPFLVVQEDNTTYHYIVE